MFKSVFFRPAAVAVAVLSVSQASFGNASIRTAVEEIARFIKGSEAVSTSMTRVTHFGPYNQPTTALLKTMPRSGKPPLHVLIYKNSQSGLDQVGIGLAVKADNSLVELVDDLPGTFRMNGDVGDAAKAAMAAANLQDEAKKVMQALLDEKLVTLNEPGQIELMSESFKKMRESAAPMPPLVMMEKSGVRINHTGQSEYLNLNYQVNVEGIGPVIEFGIKFGISPATSPEKLERIFEVAAEALL